MRGFVVADPLSLFVRLGLIVGWCFVMGGLFSLVITIPSHLFFFCSSVRCVVECGCGCQRFVEKMVVNILLFDLSSYDYNQHYSFRCPTSQVQRHMNYMARPRTPTSQCDFTMSAHAHHHLHIESFSCYSNPFHASISLFQISCI